MTYLKNIAFFFSDIPNWFEFLNYEKGHLMSNNFMSVVITLLHDLQCLNTKSYKTSPRVHDNE